MWQALANPAQPLRSSAVAVAGVCRPCTGADTMRPRSSAVPVGIFVAALSALVVLLSNDAPSMASRPATQISSAIQSQIRPDGWVRVLVELKVPSRTVPEASLRNITAVLAQRQIIGARRTRLLAKLPPGTYRLLRAYLTIPYVALDVTMASV